MFDRVYIIGFGSIGSRYYRILNDNNLCRQTLIYDRSGTKDSCENYNYFTKLNEVRAKKDDLIIVANPASYHYETLIQLHGCAAPVLLEKPLSREVLSKSKLKKLNQMFDFIHVGYNLRYHPATRLIREHVAQKTFGEVISIFGEVFSFLPEWRPKKDYTNTVSAQKELGGGVLLELSHEIDLVNFIYKKIPSISAQYDQVSCLRINVEDTAALNFKFENKKKKVLGNLNMCFASHKPSRKLLFNCTHAALEIDLSANKFSIFKDNSADVITFDKYMNRDQTYFDQIEDIYLRFSQNRKPSCSIMDANHVLGVIGSAKSSNSNLSSYQVVPK
jgi:predicted dehydrogenase